MRWIWVDKFDEFVPGERAVGVKCVTLAEDHLRDHFDGYPVMPASLMIEGMAQTAGILVGHARDFKEKVILAKIKQAVFDRIVLPGQTIRYDARIEQVTEHAASTVGTVLVDGQPVGRIDIVFSHIDQNLSGLEFPDENFVFDEGFMALLKTYLHREPERIPL